MERCCPADESSALSRWTSWGGGGRFPRRLASGQNQCVCPQQGSSFCTSTLHIMRGHVIMHRSLKHNAFYPQFATFHSKHLMLVHYRYLSFVYSLIRYNRDLCGYDPWRGLIENAKDFWSFGTGTPEIHINWLWKNLQTNHFLLILQISWRVTKTCPFLPRTGTMTWKALAAPTGITVDGGMETAATPA